VRPSQEQLIRATRLAEQHLVDWAHPDRLAPGSLRRALDRLLARPRRPVGRAGWDGAARAAETLVAAARTARSPREEAS
jgi:predicted glycosyltransferase